MQVRVAASSSLHAHERSVLTTMAVFQSWNRLNPNTTEQQISKQKIDAGLSYHLPDLIF